jgi:hypothetical protein
VRNCVISAFPPVIEATTWNALDTLFLRVAGATLLLSSAVELCLKVVSNVVQIEGKEVVLWETKSSPSRRAALSQQVQVVLR